MGKRERLSQWLRSSNTRSESGQTAPIKSTTQVSVESINSRQSSIRQPTTGRPQEDVPIRVQVSNGSSDEKTSSLPAAEGGRLEDQKSKAVSSSSVSESSPHALSSTTLNIPKPTTPISTSNSTRTPLQTTQTPFQTALKHYINTLSPSERTQFQNFQSTHPQPLTSNNLLSTIQTHTTTTTNQNQTLTRFLSILNCFLSLASTSTQCSPEPSVLALSLARAVVTVALNFAGFFDKLTKMIDVVGGYLAPLSIYSGSSSGDDHTESIASCLADVYVDVLRFLWSARAVFVDAEGRTRKWTSWRVFWRVQWVPFEEEFGGIESDLRGRLDVLGHTARAVGLEMGRLQRGREGVREREQFLTWLSDYPFEEIHSNIYAKRHPNTGDWFIEHAEYQRWFNSAGSAVLWCHGKPGAGKSVLASHIVEHITAQRALDPHVGIAFAYYKYDITEMQDSTFILSALLKQICRRAEPLPEGFTRIKQDAYPRSQVANADSFLKAIEHYDLNETFVVIDALDECPRARRPEILRSLREIVAGGSNVKLFVSSRHEPDIVSAFADLKAPHIRIEARNIENDINRYVEEETARLIKGSDGRKLYITDPTLERRIVDTLVAKAEGMFLWANLQLLHLCEESESQNDMLIEDALGALPNGLEATYQRSMDQICQQNDYRQRIAFHILKWVMYTDRPITVKELHEVLKFEERRYTGQALDHGFFVMTCANLLEVIHMGDAEDALILRPIHYSVQEFVIDSMSLEGKGARLLGGLQNKTLTHSTLATSCIDYLLRKLADAEPCKLYSNLRQRLWDLPFIWYCARSFDAHMAKGILSADLIASCEALLKQPSSFLSSLLQVRSVRHTHMHTHIPALWDNTRLHEGSATPTMIIFSTELLGMKPFAHHWDNCAVSPELLPFACAAGMRSAVEHLLIAGVDVDAVDQQGVTGIYYVAEGGDVEIVRLLIDHGVSVNSSGGKYGSPLQAAAVKNHYDVVRLLLDAGADIGADRDGYGSAIQLAAFNKNEPLMRLLIDAGASPNSPAGVYGNILTVAAYASDKPITRLLLDAGADVNAPGNVHGSALHVASDEEIIRWLIEAGADVNLQGGVYGTALHKAAKLGSEEITRLLLDTGADANVQMKPHIPPLHTAAQEGHEKTVKLMINAGADVDGLSFENSSDSFTALQLACCRDHEGVVKLLLDAGADPNRAGYPLTQALMRSEPTMLHLLLDRGAMPSKTIHAIASSLLEGKWESLQTNFFIIGRCLLLDGYVDEFRCCSRQHTARCDMCETKIYGKASMCRKCIIVDICPRCMEGWEKKCRKDCQHHEFMEVGYRVMDDEAWEDDSEDDSDTEEESITVAKDLLRRWLDLIAEKDSNAVKNTKKE